MKKFLLSLLAVGAFTAAAQDNYWAPSLVINSDSLAAKCLTNSAVGSGYASMTNVYAISGKELGLQVNIGPQTLSNNQSNLVVLVAKSIDGLNWTTLGASTISLTANLTASRSICTNITINAAKYIRLGVYTDALYAAGLTNFQVIATSK